LIGKGNAIENISEEATLAVGKVKEIIAKNLLAWIKENKPEQSEMIEFKLITLGTKVDSDSALEILSDKVSEILTELEMPEESSIDLREEINSEGINPYEEFHFGEEESDTEAESDYGKPEEENSEEKDWGNISQGFKGKEGEDLKELWIKNGFTYEQTRD